MAVKDAAAAETGSESENALLGPLTSDKFEGFSTRDGERITEKAAPAKAAAKPAKAVAEAEEDDQEADDGDAGAGEVEAKSKSAQERINKAVGKQRAAERRASAAEAAANEANQRMARLEGQMALLTSGTKPPTKDRNAPDPAEYKNGDIDAQYIADLARYEARKTTSADREANDKAAKTKADADASKALQKRVGEFSDKGSEKYDDFHEVVFDDDFHLTPVLGDLAMDSEHGAEILYALATGPHKEASRVFGLTPVRQAAWFGAKEAELSSESSDADGENEEPDEGSETPPKTTKAPQPLNHKTRGNGGVPRVNAATSDFAAFERMTKSQNGR